MLLFTIEIDVAHHDPILPNLTYITGTCRLLFIDK